MEDPTAWHVMPSRNKSEMPPPAPRPQKRVKVLPEEEYLNAAQHIIERDYYPDLQKLRSQIQVTTCFLVSYPSFGLLLN